MPRITDEELDRLLIEASSARTPIDAKPDAEAMAMLERIMATDPHPHRRRNRIVGALAGLAAAVTATVIGINVMIPTGAAVAGSPQPLDFTGATSVAETISDAQTALAAEPGPAEPARFVRSATWSFNIDGDDATAVVVPQLVTLQWEADQSGRVLVVDGTPYDPADASANVSAEVTSSGRVSMDLKMSAGEFATPVSAPPGATKEEIRGALVAFGMPAEPTAFDVLLAASSLLEQWTLTNEQESQILSILDETDGATALGSSVDRLGRDVVGMRVASADGAASDVVLLSAETGRIVGFERTNVIEDDLLPAGAVIGYRLFDVPEEAVR